MQRLIAHIPQPHLRAVFQQRLTELQNMIFIIHKVIRILRLHHQNTYRIQVLSQREQIFSLMMILQHYMQKGKTLFAVMQKFMCYIKQLFVDFV